MIRKKWLLATAAGLVAASVPLFAAPAVPSSAVSAVKATSQPRAEADNTGMDQPPAAGPIQAKSVSPLSLRKPSFYAGVGIAMLNDKGFTALMPKVMAGYGIFLGRDKRFYSALEIGGGAGTILLSTHNQKFRVSNFVNASIIPGYMIYDDVMLYARLGAQATHYSKLGTTKNGGVFGIGLELINSQHWDTRFEYNYGNNQNLNQYIVDFIYKFR